jgi:hypothetical protein
MVGIGVPSRKLLELVASNMMSVPPMWHWLLEKYTSKLIEEE